MRRRTLAIVASALLTTGGLAFAQSATKLTLGHGAAPGNPRHEAAVLFADRVKAKTNGRIEVQVAHSAQLGDDAAMVTALRTGSLDISANSQGAMANVVPEYAALGLPFLFSDVQKAWQMLDGPVGEELTKRTAAKGMVVLGYWDNGIRHVTNSKRAIKSPADIKGLKIRTPPDTMTVDIMQALGADTQQIKFAELYVALQQGVVDGQENPLANIASAKLYEVQKYLSLTGHKYEANPFVMGKRSWDRLSPGDQKIVMEAAAEATQMQRKLSKEADDKLLAELKSKGTQVETVDRKAFVEATKSVYAKWSGGPVGDFAKKVIQQAQAQ
ncbi:TRAP transporter substrate-binding protein [Ramlibacter solisilvae]|uniref:C4-dicarboxylate ABC transporter n=1 Tax=Ramlibacter tataouinensis TaxID=94132 RepID=A0A127JXD8_9BURK|nr:TRAP transporter substrate-binding protein [Ramlibacter tataouinensis]AMO24666.1 C4-dicarboxylate ABC transporter [Ramlibacter tataouinensis]